MMAAGSLHSSGIPGVLLTDSLSGMPSGACACTAATEACGGGSAETANCAASATLSYYLWQGSGYDVPVLLHEAPDSARERATRVSLSHCASHGAAAAAGGGTAVWRCHWYSSLTPGGRGRDC